MAPSKFAAGALAVAAFVVGPRTADAQVTNRSTFGRIAATVTIFGDEPVSDSRTGGGDGPWMISAGVDQQGGNGQGSAGGAITSNISPTGLIATGNYTVFAAGFGGGTSAEASMDYSASFTITQPTAYTLMLNATDSIALLGPGFNIMGPGVEINQSGVLEPGDYSFAYSGSGIGFGGQGTGGFFNIRWIIPAPGSIALALGFIPLAALRRR